VRLHIEDVEGTTPEIGGEEQEVKGRENNEARRQLVALFASGVLPFLGGVLNYLREPQGPKEHDHNGVHGEDLVKKHHRDNHKEVISAIASRGLSSDVVVVDHILVVCPPHLNQELSLN
jgi:hypothetical protein